MLAVQRRMVDGNMFVDAANGPYKSLQDLWDE